LTRKPIGPVGKKLDCFINFFGIASDICAFFEECSKLRTNLFHRFSICNVAFSFEVTLTEMNICYGPSDGGLEVGGTRHHHSSDCCFHGHELIRKVRTESRRKDGTFQDSLELSK